MSDDSHKNNGAAKVSDSQPNAPQNAFNNSHKQQRPSPSSSSESHHPSSPLTGLRKHLRPRLSLRNSSEAPAPEGPPPATTTKSFEPPAQKVELDALFAISKRRPEACRAELMAKLKGMPTSDDAAAQAMAVKEHSQNEPLPFNPVAGPSRSQSPPTSPLLQDAEDSALARALLQEEQKQEEERTRSWSALNQSDAEEHHIQRSKELEPKLKRNKDGVSTWNPFAKGRPDTTTRPAADSAAAPKSGQQSDRDAQRMKPGRGLSFLRSKGKDKTPQLLTDDEGGDDSGDDNGDDDHHRPRWTYSEKEKWKARGAAQDRSRSQPQSGQTTPRAPLQPQPQHLSQSHQEEPATDTEVPQPPPLKAAAEGPPTNLEERRPSLHDRLYPPERRSSSSNTDNDQDDGEPLLSPLADRTGGFRQAARERMQSFSPSSRRRGSRASGSSSNWTTRSSSYGQAAIEDDREPVHVEDIAAEEAAVEDEESDELGPERQRGWFGLRSFSMRSSSSSSSAGRL